MSWRRVTLGGLATALVIGGAGAVRAGHASARPTAVATVDSVRATLPAWPTIAEAPPIWRTRIAAADVPGVGPWSVYRLAGLAMSGGHVVLSDESNHQLLLVDAASGRPRQVLGVIGQGPQQLLAPTALASLGGTFALLDRGNRRIYAVGDSLASAMVLPRTRSAYLMAARDSAIYVLSQAAGRVELTTYAGLHVEARGRTRVLGVRYGAPPITMSVMPNGEIVIVPSNGVIHRIDTLGRLRQVIEFVDVQQKGAKPVRAPATDVAADAAGNLVVSVGAAVLCYSAEFRKITGAWRPPQNAAARVPVVTRLAEHGGHLATYQPSGDLLSLYRSPCTR